MQYDDDFVTRLGRQIHRYDVDLERMQRTQGMVAAAIVKVERYAQAMLSEVDAMKSALAGVTPYGMDPLPPGP